MADSTSPDAVIIGDGVIGLSTAFQLARAGASCRVHGAERPEAASAAAAGLLAPSIGSLEPEVRALFDASLGMYPAFVDDLRHHEPRLALLQGLLDLSADSAAKTGKRMSTHEVSALEPSIAAPAGGVFHATDGAIDNQRLMTALRRGARSFPSVTLTTDDPISAIDLGGNQPAVLTRSGARIQSSVIVLAAGAWSAEIRGLPRPLPVRPLKGQMLALESSALRHPVMGDDIYLVPRERAIAVGATVEDVGFDTSVSPTAIEALRKSAIGLCPSLRDAPILRTWAGLRPATPDMLPIIGPDPADDRLLYACGHSKNGILLAPLTGVVIAALAARRPAPFDIHRFRVARFSAAPN